VRTVEKGHLTFVIRSLRIGDEHLESGTVSRELCTKLFE
jgi:hypothetical protein